MTRLDWSLPQSAAAAVAHHGPEFGDDETRIALAIDLARSNIESRQGGPFGAAVFDHQSGRLIACGVNMVLSTHACVAHAEMVALTAAQQQYGTHDLSAYPLTLATSAEPCAMCLGALPWSGIRRVIIGAADADIRGIGFDEGSKPAGWVEALASRGIEVVRDVCRPAACQVLADFAQAGGRLY